MENVQNNVACICESRQGFGLDIGFDDHFNKQLVIILNYSAIADLHTSQIARPTPFPARSVFTNRSLVTAPDSGDSSASRPQVLSGWQLPSNSSQTPVQN
jgi:hypothetical protein